MQKIPVNPRIISLKNATGIPIFVEPQHEPMINSNAPLFIARGLDHHEAAVLDIFQEIKKSAK